MSEYLDAYNEREIAEIRSNFFKKREPPVKGVRTEIKNSWIRSFRSGLDPTIPLVALPVNVSEEQISPDQISRFLSNMLSEIIETLYKTLEECNAALFCAYSDTQLIYTQSGNKELLRYLNDRNIGIGSCLKEEWVGTTAASINIGQDENAYVIGSEHYLDLFVPFATWCYYSKDYASTYIFVVAPKEAFSHLFVSLLKIFCKARKYGIENYKHELELTFSHEITSQILQYKDFAYVLLDSFGKILNANDSFCEWFNLDLKTIKNAYCIEVIPELSKAVSSLETGKKIFFEEIQFKDRPANMQFARMDVIPMRQMDKITGLIIKLSNSSSVRETVNKVSNSQAYYSFENIIGESKIMKEIKQRAIRAAHSNSAVVITGESGTGKELFAQAIHNASLRRQGPFVALNCAAIPGELIASELFGYVEGAFTGARKGGSMGKFEYAHQGTIFLDEIGEMPLNTQTLLLRVLEERMVTRIGSNKPVAIDVRLICATNKNLYKMVQLGTFRSDLFYRINVIHFHLPALRERITDIPILVEYFLEYFGSNLNKQVREVAPDAMAFLINNDWPGNLRELRNTIECALNNATGPVLELKDLPMQDIETPYYDELSQTVSLDKEFAIAEKKKILSLMIEYNGNKSVVAQKLGMCRSTLYRKLKVYNL